jgi:predicted PurR-regulated permease PerM
VFGIAGLIVGPLLMSIALAILRIYAKDAAERRRRGERHVPDTAE